MVIAETQQESGEKINLKPKDPRFAPSTSNLLKKC
jgi:hypothetical protein